MMSLRHVVWQTAVLTLVLAAHVSAQFPTGYRLVRGDTLRFREVSLGEITVVTPQGSVPVSSVHDAVLAVAFDGTDTARAWYEALTLALRSPAGEQRPETQAALRQPFLLGIDSRGRVRTLRAPRFPETFEGVSDLTKQFHDFFLRLPPDLNLTVGRTWSDTVIQADSSPNGRTGEYARVIQYTVTGDTLIAGTTALAIATRQQIRLSSAGPVPGRPLTARSVLDGEDNGVYVFAPTRGRLLGRFRTGQLAGTITYEGGAQTVTIQQRYNYTNTIAAIP
jgi:hypothetical protein